MRGCGVNGNTLKLVSGLMGVIYPTIAAKRTNQPLSDLLNNERCGFESRHPQLTL